jgi:hypothetical protein
MKARNIPATYATIRHLEEDSLANINNRNMKASNGEKDTLPLTRMRYMKERNITVTFLLLPGNSSREISLQLM